jgi:hypothetical protein
VEQSSEEKPKLTTISHRRKKRRQVQWLMPVILATWEAEILGEWWFQASHRQKVLKTPS